VPLLNLPNYGFIFPNAPFPHPQIEGGQMWYDFEEGNQGLVESRQLLLDWLNSLESNTGIPLSRTILGGFSQGAAMTLDVGLDLPLAGLIALSGYLHPVQKPVSSSIPPILMVHGRSDVVVPLAAAQSAQAQLTKLGASVDYYEFEMGHEIHPEVIQQVENFVLKHLPR
jgi:phospholipase/carboxylesterase